MRNFESTFVALFVFAAVGCGASEDPQSGPEESEEMQDGAGGEGPTLASCTDAECDDGEYCNGEELCRPESGEADEEGCVAGEPPCGVDELCSESAAECVDECPDNDGDGHTEESCGGDDCNDFDANRYPGNEEVCDGSHDEDCDPNTLGVDEDGDGEPPLECCNPGSDGELVCGTDCDDESMEVNTEATEVCNGQDDDCDGIVDNGMLIPFYPDVDRDGYGDQNGETLLACTSPLNYSPFPTDCNDDEPSSNPRNAETCDGVDNDCNGLLDAPDEDDDGDGFADACAGLDASETDCDDAVATTYPGAVELCNGIDDDCDGSPALGDDIDGDGHAAEDAVCLGGPLPLDDCDDSVSTTYLGAPELCNGVDDDCNDVVDDPGALCSLANADGDCNEGACEISGCQGPFLDCDLLDATGCEEDSTRSVKACGDCSTQCATDEHCKNSVCEKDLRWVFESPERVDGVTLGSGGTTLLLGEYSGASVTFGGVTATPCGGACTDGGYATLLDGTGTPVWAQAFADIQSTSLSRGAVHSSGDFVVFGTFTTDGMNITGHQFYNRGAADGFLVRLDKDDGSPIWSRELGGTAAESVRDVIVVGDAIYALVGTQSSVFRAGNLGVSKQSDWPDYWSALVKLDAADGTVLWAKGIGANANGLAEVDGEVVVGGEFWKETITIDGLTMSGTDCRETCTSGPCYTWCLEDLYLIRFDTNGVAQWMRSYPGDHQESMWSLTSHDGDLYVVGRFQGELAGVTFPEMLGLAARFSGEDGAPLFARSTPAGFAHYQAFIGAEAADWTLLSYNDGAPEFGGEMLPDAGGSGDSLIGQVAADGEQGWSFHLGDPDSGDTVWGQLKAEDDLAVYYGYYRGDALDVGGVGLVGTGGSDDHFVAGLQRN